MIISLFLLHSGKLMVLFFLGLTYYWIFKEAKL